jgi:hypothetical protein
VEPSFLVVVGIALLLLSAMIGVRMAAGGAPRRRIAVVIGELWLVLIIWTAVFRVIGVTIGAPVGEGGLGELRNLGSRLASLTGAARMGIAAGVLVSVALVAHFMWCLRRHMCGGIQPPGEE